MKKVFIKRRCIKTILSLMLLASLQICLLSTCIYAQKQDMQFRHLTINDGLSHSWVMTIIQDKYGFIWIGTDDGLNRYDGYNFRVYKRNEKNEYSINSSNIRTIMEDHSGNLWIGTRRGLNRYDRENDRFFHYERLPEVAVLSIVENQNNKFWIGTSNGLYHLDLTDDSLVFFGPEEASRKKISRTIGGTMSRVFIDTKNNVWITTLDGLHLYDEVNKEFFNYYHNDNDPFSIGNDDIRSILEDSYGRLWIGTSNGLDLMIDSQDQLKDRKFVHYKHDDNDPNSIASGAVLSLLEDNKNNLWIGTENGGLNLMDLKNQRGGINKFVHYKADPAKESALSNNSIYSLFQDRQNNIWIGTFGDGINLMNPLTQKFVTFQSHPGNSLSNNKVNVFLEEKDMVWIGTEGGLNRYNKKDGTFKIFTNNPFDKKSIGSDAIWALCKDRSGNLWIGTWGGGLNKFNYKNETFEHYYNNPNDTNSIGSNNIFSIFEDSQGSLWIGTMGGGLNLFERRGKRFIRYDNMNSGIYTNYVSAIIESRDGSLWIANETQFERFDRKTKEFEHFIYRKDDSTSLSGDKAISLLEDTKGNLWLGTGDGLNLYLKSTKGFRRYQIEDGLPDNSINSIVEDLRGNLWLGTNKGLSEFINGTNLPEVPKFRNFTAEDGLQGNEFGRRSGLCGANGWLYFGGSNGFNIFNPDNMQENTYIPPVVITDFQIFNKSVNIGKRGLGTKAEKDLVLSHTQSVFSFDFAALNYYGTQKNQYAYMMEGFDDGWNYIGTKHTVTYTNLNPGKYIFRVKGSNNDGVWNEEGAYISIAIMPPFWQTLWFRGILLIVVIGCIYWIYRWKIQARDLAEQKRLDSALARERNLLRTLIDNIPDGIYIKDKECRKVVVNLADVQHLHGKSESEVLGKNDFDMYPEEIAEGFYADDQQVLRTGQPVIEREEFIIDDKGEKRWLLTTKIPLRDEKNQIIGLVGIGHDITERKKAQEEREKLIGDLKEALADVKMLSGLVPICANCKKIRDDKGYWTQLEAYIQDRSDARFSHSICPDCAAKLYPNYHIKKE